MGGGQGGSEEQESSERHLYIRKRTGKNVTFFFRKFPSFAARPSGESSEEDEQEEKTFRVVTVVA